jgi:hypothetical protein
VEAKQLMKMDIGVLGKGKSDPYAVIMVGAQDFRTHTINNTVNPKWDFWCEVSVCFCSLLSVIAVSRGNSTIAIFQHYIGGMEKELGISFRIFNPYCCLRNWDRKFLMSSTKFVIATLLTL